MSWASRRRNLYLATFGTLSLVTLSLLGVLVFYRAPTCSDGRHNGNETGIDCGGGCKRICRADAAAPIIRWSRSFEVRDGLFSAVAYVENPNARAGTRRAPYVFKLFDADNVIVAIKEGETALPAGVPTAVFYANIATGSRTPVRTFFEFTDDISWERAEANLSPLRVVQSMLENEAGAPRLTAAIENATAAGLPRGILTAILYDGEGNAVAASQTVFPALPRGGSDIAVFTWPKPLPRPISRIEVLPTIPLPDGR